MKTLHRVLFVALLAVCLPGCSASCDVPPEDRARIKRVRETEVAREAARESLRIEHERLERERIDREHEKHRR